MKFLTLLKRENLTKTVFNLSQSLDYFNDVDLALISILALLENSFMSILLIAAYNSTENLIASTLV